MNIINPYAAPPAPPRVPDVPIMPAGRLRRLGARADQLVALGEAWDAMTVEERKEMVDSLALMTDPQLVEVLHGDGFTLR